MRRRLPGIVTAIAYVALIVIPLAWAVISGTQAARLVRTAALEKQHLEADRQMIPMLARLKTQVAALRDEVAQESSKPAAPQDDSAFLELFGSTARSAGVQLAEFSPPGGNPTRAGHVTFAGDFQALVRALGSVERVRGLSIDQVALDSRGGTLRLEVKYRTIPTELAGSVPPAPAGGDRK